MAGMVVSSRRVQGGMQVKAVSGQMPRAHAVAFVGYVLYSVYVCMTFYSPTTISSVVEIGYLPKALYLFYIILGRMIALAALALVLARRKKQAPLSVMVAASAACALVGFAVMAIVFQMTAVAALDALLPWFFATTFLPAPVPWIVAVTAFFGSLVCCAHVLKRPEETLRPVDAAVDRRSFRRLIRPLLGVALMAFMAGLMMNVAGQEKISLGTYQWTAFVIMFALNGILLLPALLAPRAFSVPRLYKFILPLSALGFLLLPVAWDASGRGMVNSFVQVGFTFTNVIFFCLIAEEYRREQGSSIKTFSLMQLMVMAANFAGLFLAFFGIGYLEPGDLMLTITALVAVYLILAATLVLFKDKSLSVTEGEKEGADEGAGSVDKPTHADPVRTDSVRAAQLMERAGLSVREREVLEHLRQGRAPKTIAKVLFVSENTVRFHIRNIYQKFGVHSRTQLMELFDEELDARETVERSGGS